MNIEITEAAATYLIEEMGLKAGDYLRFFARYGGCGNAQTGFSLGMSKEEPNSLGIEVTKKDITFFMEKDDLWFLDDRDLFVSIKEEEIIFDFK